MDLTLLGTGGGAGWPHPFCTCASCAAATSEGEIRAHTSALIDGVLLVDCGQDVPRSAVRLGVRLDGVRHLLVTHDHHDHANGAALLWRRWARCTGPLEVIGPRSALDALAQWLPPDDPGVDFTPVVAGDIVQLGDYTVRVLAAEHDSEGAVIYDIADSAHRLLYATDTGPGFATPRGARYDLLLLENSWGESPPGDETRHHDLASFATTLARLRREHAIDDGSRVVAVHLGHGNPAPSVLRDRLTAMGAELLPDGAEIHLGRADGSALATRRSARPQRILVLGGARSGKSLTAERLLAAEPLVTYVATAAHAPDDEEWRDRVATHRARRPAGWTTVESAVLGVDGLAELLEARLPADAPLLIDCLTLWLAHVMDVVEVWTATDDVAAKAADVELAAAVDALVLAWRTTRGDVVAVSNEVGSGVVPAHPSGRRFRDELGGLNARLAAASDDVLLVEAGISRSLFPQRVSHHEPSESS